MTTFGVTPTGFKLKRLTDILTDLRQQLSSVQDPISGEYLTVDLANENDPLVQLVNSLSDQLAVVWEQLEVAHNQFDPTKSFGAGLSGLVLLNGIRRLPGTASTVQLTLTGTPGKQVDAGKRVSTMDDSVTFSLPAFTISPGGSISVIGTAIEEGPLEAEAGKVVKIVSPVPGWDSVTNPFDAIPGAYEQDDASLRGLQRLSTENTARGMIDDIFSSINSLPGVTHCRVYQNSSLETGSRGIPAKAIAPVVLGGEPDDIYQMIYSHIPLAVDTYGTEEKIFIDEQGFDYPIRFSRPTQISIHVEVTISPFSSAWPSDAEDLIKAEILAYAAQNYLPGVSVYASQLYCPVNKVEGAQIVQILVGAVSADGVFAEVEWNEVAIFSLENIVVLEA